METHGMKLPTHAFSADVKKVATSAVTESAELSHTMHLSTQQPYSVILHGLPLCTWAATW